MWNFLLNCLIYFAFLFHFVGSCYTIALCSQLGNFGIDGKILFVLSKLLLNYFILLLDFHYDVNCFEGVIVLFGYGENFGKH